MLESFVNGVILGIGVSVPFGPVNMLIINSALHSFKNAFCIGFGALIADIIYLGLVNFGILQFMNTEFLQLLGIFGFCFLSYLAFLNVKNKPQKLKLNTTQIQEKPLKNCMKGIFLNLTNPYVIGFWISVATLSTSHLYPFLLNLGLICFIFLWIFSLSFFVGKFSHFFSAKVIYLINIFSALIIEYFALSLLYKTFLG
ncbi:LysE family transporter [Campylobacter sp. MIT 21-1685]|uniref:LysE family transporter n=1 Tax=unclassified Campylobacter TaxID=2593542 RepID=UPI00224B2DA0|nr:MULTISPECIES: LysE family transporter [unclassified Campylobacter]MCX2683149.1 LysE family transporter [Campylobacter sp. MIT 21-1684]MCX2751392.1 LysE family transporter [Campylobacter sp. MIT 21-1682]MCX2807591.1 LysE family transporter [Campylobacter sp. MIT 21-1685]